MCILYVSSNWRKVEVSRDWTNRRIGLKTVYCPVKTTSATNWKSGKRAHLRLVGYQCSFGLVLETENSDELVRSLSYLTFQVTRVTVPDQNWDNDRLAHWTYTVKEEGPVVKEQIFVFPQRLFGKVGMFYRNESGKSYLGNWRLEEGNGVRVQEQAPNVVTRMREKKNWYRNRNGI